MIVIAHRANINGPNALSENTLEACYNCLERGYDVELDVWLVDNKLRLSHHYPDTTVDIVPPELLKNDKIWWHAKNKEALNYLLHRDNNVFWHQEDEYTLTSKGFIWAFPGMPLSDKSIAVLPEQSLQKVPRWAYGICTDQPQNIDNFLFN